MNPTLTLPTQGVGRLMPVAPPYNLRKTLSCGQVFRWRWGGEAAVGVFAGRRVRLAQDARGIQVEGLEDKRDLLALRRYLRLDEPLAEIETALARDRVLRRLLPATSGIAVMRQDPWECLVSFIVSAFNNIPKIELTLDRLSQRFGAALGPDAWTFPPPARLAAAAPRELRACALGYRAAYVSEVARLVAGGGFSFSALEGLSYGEARRLLLGLPGVGDKVADCTLLFAYGKGEAFPVDVWVKRAVERWYFGSRMKTEREIRALAQRRFGALAGYAQQHLYYYIRERGTGNGERRRIRARETSVSPRPGRRPAR